eukprot:6631623-Pyramimonas_sp.AAC.2
MQESDYHHTAQVGAVGADERQNVICTSARTRVGVGSICDCFVGCRRTTLYVLFTLFCVTSPSIVHSSPSSCYPQPTSSELGNVQRPRAGVTPRFPPSFLDQGVVICHIDAQHNALRRRNYPSLWRGVRSVKYPPTAARVAALRERNAVIKKHQKGLRCIAACRITPHRLCCVADHIPLQDKKFFEQ